MARHQLPNGKTLTAEEVAAVTAFVRSIDEGTTRVESDTDKFLK